MAAVRVRLVFDYPPPLLPAGRMCWLLLQLEQCRVVADLESIIRQRFGFSGRTLLHLFLDGCLLPPNESVYLVRDNDSIRVKQEELITENGFATSNSPDRPSVKPKKRHRHRSVEKHQLGSENGQKKKRRKDAGLSEEQRHDSTGETVSNVSTECSRKRKKETEGDEKYNVQKKHCKKKKDKSGKDQMESDRSTKRAQSGALGKAFPEPTAVRSLPKLGGKKNASNNPAFQRKVAAQDSDSEISSGDLSENDCPRPKNPAPPAASTSTKGMKGLDSGSSASKSCTAQSTGKRPVQTNTATKMVGAKADSSSDSLSSDLERPPVKKASTPKPGAPSLADGSISGLSKNGAISNAARSSSEASSDSQDSESDRPAGAETTEQSKTGLQPTAPTLPPNQARNGGFGRGNGRGRGRGFGTFPWDGAGGRQHRNLFRGRGRGAALFCYNYENSQDPKPGESNETVTDKPAIVENPPDVPKRDYSKFPLLAAPPQVGERIAFKVLELSDNYTPELSDYKEGRIMNYNPSTQEVELSVDSISTESSKEPGKFDLIYQTENGEELVEYAVTRKPQVTESWNSLVEPRLIITPAAEAVPVELA
ncbi:coilin [Heptranchias perlo]|uniref:coilin n=1 Tax=Heptranchias perlo TaxID=212740 RepID=UPI0035598FB5